MFRALGMAAAAVCALGISTAQANEETIELASVPAQARQAVAKAVPGLKLMQATRDLEDGKTIYTLTGEDAKEREIEVEVTAGGTVLSISVEVELRSVPRVVMQALRTKMRGFRPTDAWAVWINGKLEAYGFEGKDGKGEDLEVTVTPDGSKVEIEDDDD